MAQAWFIDSGDGVDGPLPSRELRQRAGDGRIGPDARVSVDRRNWVRAARVRGLRFAGDARTPGGQALTPTTALTTPNVLRRFPGYVLERIIGEGGCGVVYSAVQERLRRPAAVKAVPCHRDAHPALLARFEQEAVTLGRLRHPNIVQVYDAGVCDGQMFFSMELLEGEDLARRLDRSGPLDERTAWLLARQAACALAHAAERGVTHRDIKPSNLFLVRAPAGCGLPPGLPMVKVMDFGLARDRHAGNPLLTQTDIVLGTAAYMAPEQFLSAGVDLRADIYALGATVFHMLTGAPPFAGASPWHIAKLKAGSALRLGRDCSAESAALLAAMTTPDPRRRVASHEELIERIDRLLTNRPAYTKPALRGDPFMLVRLLTLVLFAFLGVFYGWNAADDKEKPVAPEFTKVSKWLNGKAVKMADLKDKVVVVHFWAHGCYNCVNNYPHYRAWQDRYKDDKNLVIVGIHSPEFAREKDFDGIQTQADKHKLTFRVAVDNDMANWKAWGNRYWPCVYLVDKTGKVQYRWEGELGEKGYKSATKRIDELLAEKP